MSAQHEQQESTLNCMTDTMLPAAKELCSPATTESCCQLVGDELDCCKNGVCSIMWKPTRPHS